MKGGTWDTVALADLVEDAIGGLWGSPPDSSKPDVSDVSVIRGADFRRWSTRRSKDAALRRIPSRSLERRRLESGDLVLEVSGGSPAQPVGRVLLIDSQAVSESSRPLICSNFCRKLRLKRHVDPSFVKRQLDQCYRSGLVNRFQTATTNIRNLQVDDFLRGMELELPPLQEQIRLAALLDEMDKCDLSLCGHVAAARMAVARFRQSVLAAACSGRLTADWREGNGSPSAPSGVPQSAGELEPLAETPPEWVWCHLADIADVKGGVQKGGKLRPGEQTRQVPYLRVANVQRGWLDLTEIKTIEATERRIAELRLRPGDVLFNEGGDRDKLGRGWVWDGQMDECIHQNHVFRARLKLPGMQPRFLSWYGNTYGASYFLDRGKQTVNLASLNMSTLRALPVPVPNPIEQAEIVRRVEGLFALADGAFHRIEVAQAAAANGFRAIQAKAFHGDLSTETSDDAD